MTKFITKLRKHFNIEKINLFNFLLNYSTIKKEILSIVLCISKFQSDLLNQKFLIRIDCKSAKHVLIYIYIYIGAALHTPQGFK